MRIDNNLAELGRETASIARQLPFAAALALNRTAQDVESNTQKRIARVFDRPTPFTRNAVVIRRANKRNLEAVVGIKRVQAEYLEIQETGGVRRPKGRALVLPAEARVNRYGNLPRGAVRRALARSDTFSGTVSGVAGVWQRTKTGDLKLLVAYEPRASYRPRFGFVDGAMKTIRARLAPQLSRAIAAAMRTARR